MKKLMMLCLLLGAVAFVQAQTKDSTLNDFVGKYKFPEGSIVTEVVVSMEGEGLIMGSSVGNSTLVKAGEDLFTITAYDGTAQFKRDANKKVIGVNINAGGYVLEGTKSDGIALNHAAAMLLKRQLYALRK
ncbi:hypothetical protein [Sediminibacterium goheungense]|uniref:Uncharacterized protein n=1 Tax=Sediminibacterium goheungense TaxID=1086393 RepID=A0A4R6IVY1_9BACT|nr:hypothetical protein [Sediminibacterium goheungense]TDO26840.1 hypothetical protein BC659_2152 [Sediminibacterium goheungense]